MHKRMEREMHRKWREEHEVREDLIELVEGTRLLG